MCVGVGVLVCVCVRALLKCVVSRARLPRGSDSAFRRIFSICRYPASDTSWKFSKKGTPSCGHGEGRFLALQPSFPLGSNHVRSLIGFVFFFVRAAPTFLLPSFPKRFRVFFPRLSSAPHCSPYHCITTSKLLPTKKQPSLPLSPHPQPQHPAVSSDSHKPPIPFPHSLSPPNTRLT